METGDPCFAHVRSFPWWPAKVVKKSVSNSKVRKEVFQVLFYGTGETALLPLKELAAISPDAVAKFSTPAAMRRKFFREGLDQMKAEFGWIPHTTTQSDTTSANTETLPSPQPTSVKKAKVIPAKMLSITTHISSTDAKLTSQKKVTSPLKEITNVTSANDDIEAQDALNEGFDWGEFEPPVFYKKLKPLKKRDFFASERKSHSCEEFVETFAIQRFAQTFCSRRSSCGWYAWKSIQ